MRPTLRPVLVPAVVWAVLAAACGGGDDGGGPSVAEGEELYAYNCASCHGQDLGGTDAGPPLVHEVYEPSHHPDEAFQRAVAEGVQPHHWDFGPMPPLQGLDEDDVRDIIAYVRAEQRAAGIG